jgi:hypothetical protein
MFLVPHPGGLPQPRAQDGRDHGTVHCGEMVQTGQDLHIPAGGDQRIRVPHKRLTDTHPDAAPLLAVVHLVGRQLQQEQPLPAPAADVASRPVLTIRISGRTSHSGGSRPRLPSGWKPCLR